MTSPPISLCSVISFAIAVNLIRLYISNSKKQHNPLPPGPRPDPLIGNLRSIPPTDHHIFFHELGKTYGDVCYLNAMGRSIVILNSVEAATDLMEKRSSNYSDRPPIRVFSLMGWKKVLSFIRYGKEFQLHRKIFQQHLHKLQNKSYRPLLLTEARALAQNLLGDPKEKNNIVARFSTSIILSVTYGHRVKSDEDRYVLLANEVGRAMATAGALGSSLLDFLPFLQYMPSWFPGTYYANYARKWAPKVREFRDLPFEDVQRQMKEGTAKPCLLVSELEALEHRAIDSKKTIEDIKGATSTAYLAGVETTSSALFVFILAMILHPECQAKAQAELDAVVGSQRLPEFDDRDSLPYLECLLHETLRWQSPLPTGIPRLTIDDDVYRGMFIPKGSVVIGNVRGMSWDERTYANPFSFEPTRYLPAPLGRGEPRPEAHWGFGRRICPGRHLADSSLWIAMATMLSTLSLSKALDRDGNEITPELTFITVSTCRPKPFLFRTTPRSQAATAVLSQAEIMQDY